MANPTFLCEHCSAAVGYDDRVCPSCKRIFSGVRCPKCEFKGPGRQFLRGCPQCGYATDHGQQVATFQIVSMDAVDVSDVSRIHKNTERKNRRYQMHRLHWHALSYHHGIGALIGLILLAALFYVVLL